MISTPRRYYLLKAAVARAACDDMETVWRGKQKAEPGTVLSPSFPYVTELAAAGYFTDTDLAGAEEDELVSAGLNGAQARRVLASLP